jgi:hypothetical protein
MAQYIVDEISTSEQFNNNISSNRFSISNLLGSPPQPSVPSFGAGTRSLQERVDLWLQCCQQDKGVIDSALSALGSSSSPSSSLKRFLCQVYLEFPEVMMVGGGGCGINGLRLDSWTEEEVCSLLDSVSHGLVSAVANTQPGKEWIKRQAHDYEICLRKLAFLHPQLVLRYFHAYFRFEFPELPPP